MLKEKLTDFIATQFLDGERDGLELDTPLFELNIVDSAAIFDLVDFLKAQTNLNIGMQDIHPGNFATIAAMVALCDSLQHNQTQGATA
ncbi:acyl carrier protein [Pseudoalteromonas xiamenensis]|uniref:acyl carrier protein n=1 Tax=Pseudoalteromonas xiamenensis TaxID=882626 RepID=UPI0035ECFDA1